MDYSALAWDPEYIKRMKMMQMQNPMPYSSEVASSPTPTLQMLYGKDSTGSSMLNRTPPPTGMGWMDYAGIGAMAAAPVASALLNKEPVRSPGFVGGASVGSKPMMQVNPNIYPERQRMPAFLARLLMGAR